VKAYTYQLPVVLAAVSIFISAMPASAQLPPVNWGKSVHGPGDNQYVGDQQGMRHPPNATPTRPQMVPMGPPGGGGGGGGPIAYRSAPKQPKPDISLQPIPADEPIAPPGFPPLPDRLDLPGVDTTTAMSTFNATSGGGGGGGGYGGGGGGGGGAPAPNPFQGKKQGYQHFAPGSFSGQPMGGGGGGGGGGGMPPMGGGGGGGGDVSFHQHYGHTAPGAFAEPKQKGVGYYKCGETAKQSKPVSFEESFGSDSGSKPPAYSGATDKDLKKLGREPKLNDRQNGGDSQPEAPQPVQINQAATQDLSLPDDEFHSKRPPNKAGKALGKVGRRIMNRAGAMMNQGMGMAGMGGMGR